MSDNQAVPGATARPKRRPLWASAKRRARKLLKRLRRPAETPIEVASGSVDEVGPGAIIGTLNIAPDVPPVRVTLFVNSIDVDRVDVPPSDTGATGFRFPVKDMWAFCGPGDRVTVRVGSAYLRMPDGTLHYTPTAERVRPLSLLKKRLLAGEIINSQGRLALPKYLDVDWQRAVTDVYQQIHDAVRELTGYESFLIYGSLLGAVREGRPLGHDFDLDSAYLSKHTDPALVTEEAGQLALALQERGFAVEARMTCIHVSDPMRRQRIDLYHTYFNDDDELRLAWGAVSETPFRRSQWQGTREVEFGGADVLIPANAEELVATLYGPNWRTPNPGFDWATSRSVRASEAYFPAALRPIINWQDYWLHTTFDAPSAFAQFVTQQPSGYGLVVDLGCGDGRDDPLFLRTGARVIGLDRARAAIESARDRGLAPDRAQFALCDVAEPGSLRSALASRDVDHPHTLYYARHLLDSVAAGVQAALLSEIGERMVPGDAIALEFRGLQDETLTPHELRSCGRRVVDADSVRDALTAAGLSIEVDAEDSRWESRGAKAVYLHRMIARRSA